MFKREPTELDYPRQEPPLTDEELRRTRKIIEADARARWFWASVRTFSLWLSAVVIGVASLKSFLADLLSKH